MNKRKVEISRSLNSTSANIIWQLIGTADGLARWVADEVVKDGNELTFTWGSTWSHHEIKKATVVACEKNCRLRFRWDSEENPDAFVELRMEKDVLSNDYMLHITDFAEPDDEDGLRDMWDINMERLHQSSGL